MNIIVTGASRGIGYELVKLLSADSDNNIVAISRNKEKLQQLKSDCLSLHPKSTINTIPADLSDLKSIFISEILKHMETVDILINNAGAIINKPFEKITQGELHAVYSVNVFAVVKIIQELLPYMGKTGRSHIVNISSMGAFQGSTKFSGLSAYSSSKAALANLTECLAEEFKDRNIAVNCLALGAAQTEMLNEAFPNYKAPLTAQQMAEFIHYFSLNGQNYFNGKILPVALSTP